MADLSTSEDVDASARPNGGEPQQAALADLQDERLIGQDSLRAVVSGFWHRLRGGELGSLPVVIGLVLICVVFYLIEPRFLSSYILVSLAKFAAPTGIIALGIVLVLLLGEIDLSVGTLSGFGSAVMAVLLVRQDQSMPIAMLGGVLVGTCVGLVFGILRTRIGVPSFVFSLAGLIGFKGALLLTLGSDGTITVPNDSWLVQFAKFGFLSSTQAYVLVALVTLAFLGSRLYSRARRIRAGLSGTWLPLVIGQTVALGGGLGFLTYYLHIDRGWPKVWVLFAALVVLVELVLRTTTWGRHVFAVGGNEEAARRSGVKVNRVYVSVFMICSSLSALGGLMAAGVLGSVSQASGTNGLELTAIAAAVIGGASLFGGRGSAYAAMLGVLVLQAIESGLNLVNVDSSIRFMTTGGVLLLAVAIDSVSRRARAASGRG